MRRLGHEIERRKRAEEELKALVSEMSTVARRAEEASRSKSDFLATMNHELRTPLNSIIGFTQLLRTPETATEDNRESYLGIIEHSAEHLLGIINDILSLSKVEAGQMDVHRETIPIKHVVENCLNLMEAAFQQKNQIITCDIVDGEISTDPRLLKQILLNLLSNASKFTPYGGAIDISAQPYGAQWRFKVTDTGCGMSDREIKLAMQPFVQVASAKTRPEEGTGLGLPLVDRFCKLLGGDIVLFSEKGKGTSVRVTLPDIAENENDTLI